MMRAAIASVGLTAALSLFTQTPALAEMPWIKAETAHFIIYSDNDEKTTRDYASKLEAFNTIAIDFYSRLSDTEVNNTTKPVFYFFSRLSTFQTVRPVLRDGFNFTLSCRDGVTNFWANNIAINTDAVEEYQFQNLNSLVSTRYSSGMPDWLKRGLNLYLLTANIKDGTVQLGTASRYQFSYVGDESSDNTRSLMAKNARIPYAEILSGNLSNPKKTGSIPGQSWIITHYMLTDLKNLAKLYVYIDLYDHSTPSLEAWKKAVGVDPTFFDDLTVSYMTKGVPVVTYKFVPLADKDITVTHLPAYTDTVPMLSAAIETCPDKNDRPVLESRLEKAAAAMPGDTYVQREAARAQIWFDPSPEKALNYVQSQITANPKDYDAHYLLGRLWLRQAESGQADKYAQARAELGTAYQLNPTYAPLLYYYAKSFADRPDYPSDNTLSAAEAALDLANDSDYRFYLAELYVRRDLYEDAAETLKPYVQPTGKSVSAVITQQIVDAMAAHKPKSEIIPLFAKYTDNPWGLFKK